MSVAEHQILACDIGLKRIGCAHRLQGIILPLSPIIRHNRNQAASALTNLLNTRDIRILVVGIPRDNATTTERIKHFVKKLDFCGEVVYIDEDFTSINALESLQHVRKKAKKTYIKNGTLDSLAACEILERYFALVSSTTNRIEVD